MCVRRTHTLLHDAHDHWPLLLKGKPSRQGTRFNQTALTLDAALAGQGVALACRAFVAADLAAGRLVQVTDTCTVTEPNYYLVRKRSASPRKAVDAVWAWCADRLAVFP